MPSLILPKFEDLIDKGGQALIDEYTIPNQACIDQQIHPASIFKKPMSRFREFNPQLFDPPDFGGTLVSKYHEWSTNVMYFHTEVPYQGCIALSLSTRLMHSPYVTNRELQEAMFNSWEIIFNQGWYDVHLYRPPWRLAI